MDNYTVKQVEHIPGNLPNWAIYEQDEITPLLVCLCYTEAHARRIATLLAQADAAHLPGDNQAGELAL